MDHLFNFDLRPFFHASRTKQGTLHATPVEPLDRAKWHDWLAPELRKYSMELFYPCFHVYPCDVLEINGRRSGGTVWRLGVVIADPRDARSGARFFAAYTLHHEVATWLLLGYDFESWDEWFAVIPLGFEYLDDEAEADRRGWGAPGIADEALLKRGFVTQYAQVSMDNDFAEICAHLFMSQPEFWAAFDRYEAIRTKATLAIEFFASLDPRFSESYFRSLSPPGGERSGSAGG